MFSYDDVTDRLAQLGYTAIEADEDSINFEIDKWINYTVIYCNLASSDDIPILTYPRIIDKICGSFLSGKKNLGTLTNFDYGAAVKSIKEGDTQISYNESGSSEESRFDDVMKQLDRGFNNWLTPFRKLRW